MLIRIAVAVDGQVAPNLLQVTGPVGASWAEAEPLVRAALGIDDKVSVTVAGRPVAPGSPMGVPPLVDGARLVASGPAARPMGAPPDPRSPATEPLARLSVDSGPDAGALLDLFVGDVVIGRGEGCGLRVRDPALSRRHALVRTTAEGVAVIDLGSVNGTRVAGRSAAGGFVEVAPGAQIALGGSLLGVRAADPAPERLCVTPAGDGTVLVDRRVRSGGARPAPTVTYPDPPPERPGPRLSLVTIAAPMLLSGVLAMVLSSPVYLLLGLSAPVMALAQYLGDRRSGRRDRMQAQAEHAERVRVADTDVRTASAAEHRARHEDDPPPAVVARTVCVRGVRLWERQPGDADFLRVRVGSGVVEARLGIARSGLVTHPRLDECPVTVDLRGSALGIHGSPDLVRGFARGVVTQLSAWHGPDTLTISALGGTPTDHPAWSWLDWLPHAAGGSAEVVLAESLPELTRRTAQRTAGHTAAHPAGTRWTDAHRLLLLDLCDASSEQAAALAVRLDTLLRDGPALGFPVLALAAERHRLPGRCAAVIGVGPGAVRLETGGTGETERGEDARTVVARPEFLSMDRARQVAQDLAAVRPRIRAAGGPALHNANLDLAEVLGLDVTAEALTAELLSRWAAPLEAVVTLGVCGGPAGSTLRLDLDTDGPHLLIAGMTGSGKSELLQTVITSLVMGNGPRGLALILLDYKGGSACDAFARLPHTVAVLTDLAPQETDRALRSLHAELRRRERLLRDAGVVDFTTYRAAVRATPGTVSPDLPRLVIVVDEYRVLAEEHPDFLTGLVRIAGLGRSLGIHLILATQRPAGVVSADIRANVNARIALRVRDPAESHDIIDAPDAARIPTGTPGRALLRVGSAPPVSFQAVRVTLGSAAGEPELRVTVLAGRDARPVVPPDGPPAAPAASAASAVNDPPPNLRDAVVAAALEAAAVTSAGRAASPWLPPLPPVLSVASLMARSDGAPRSGTGDGPADADRVAPRPAAVFGLVDDPDRQSQHTLAWSPETDGHLALVGTSRTGRTSALLTLAAGLALHCPAQLHLYALDAGGRLDALDELPQCAGRATLGEIALMRRIIELAHDRLQSPPPGPDHAPRPLLVLFVDGWDQVVTALEPLDHGRSVDRLLDLVKHGQSAGVRLVGTGDRALLMGAVASAIEHKVVLRLADPTDLLLTGVSRRGSVGGTRTASEDPPPPPGRGIVARSGLAVQLALLTDTAADLDSQARALAPHARRAANDHRGCPPGPRRMRPLPRVVRLDHLDTSTLPPASIPFGVLGSGRPAGVDLTGSVMVVAGPRGSGRTTALRTIARGLFSRGRHVLVLRSRPEQEFVPTGPSHPGFTAMTTTEPGASERITRFLTGRPDAAVILDDLHTTPDDVAAAVLTHLRGCPVGGGTVIAAALASELGASYTGLAGALRRGDGVILNPTGRDAPILSTCVPAGEDPVPGRGYWVENSRARPVQIALTDLLDPLDPAEAGS